MCSHAYANKEEGAPSQFTPPPHTFPLGWASAVGGAGLREGERS